MTRPLRTESVEEIAAAIRGTREYAAGAAFAVPLEARASHSTALATAAEEVLAGRLEDARRATRLALGMLFAVALIAAIREL